MAGRQQAVSVVVRAEVDDSHLELPAQSREKEVQVERDFALGAHSRDKLPSARSHLLSLLKQPRLLGTKGSHT